MSKIERQWYPLRPPDTAGLQRRRYERSDPEFWRQISNRLFHLAITCLRAY